MTSHTSKPSTASHSWISYLGGSIAALVIFLAGATAMWAYLSWDEIKPPAAHVSSQRKKANEPVETALIKEAWQIISDDFFGDMPSEKTRTYGAIKGSVQTLDDPYTYFIEPEPAGREQEQLQGRFGGIGAYLELTEDGVITLTPMVDRPAARAGVHKGDILIAVDDQIIETPTDLDNVTNIIRGEVGTKVKLTVKRGDEKLKIEVERAEIELPSVTWRTLTEAEGAGYIRIERFSSLTDKEFTQALNELQQQKANRALLIDLRGNPGGLVDAAVDVASHFLDGGTVLIEKHSDGSQKIYQAKAGSDIPDETPIVLLVDGNTASAAEILAGALQDRGRAAVIGQKTYGKGSIQRIHRLSDGSALHVTFAKWFTPDGKAIDEQGLEPDILVEPNPDYDAFLKAGLAEISP